MAQALIEASTDLQDVMDTTHSIQPPVFVHSMFRSGSTYVFDKFRRTGHFTCFQEPCNEALIDLDSRPESFLKQPDFDSRSLRHPSLDAPYFYEFYIIRDRLKGQFKKRFSFDEYFAGSQLTREQYDYFGTLIESASNTPLLQFCRSAGRVGALKNAFGGCHIHLWREPRGQWWSYKISSYFDATTQATYGATHVPEVLAKIGSQTHFHAFHGRSVNREISFYRDHPLCARECYRLFFGLWLYSFIEYERSAAVTVCINKLHQSDYRMMIADALTAQGVNMPNFDDAKLMHSTFSEAETGFYESVEEEVARTFRECDYDPQEINEAMSQARAGVSLMPERAIDSLKDELQKLRLLVIDPPGTAQGFSERQRRPFFRLPSFS